MRAYVVVNRRAGRLRRGGPFLEEARRARDGIGVVETWSTEDLDAFARDLARRGGAAAVILAGGDGSHMAGVSALVRAFGPADVPAVALAPGGTVCTIARNWSSAAGGAPALTRLRRILDGAAAGTLQRTRRPTLRVRAAADERIGFIAGAGLVARFFEAYTAGTTGGIAHAAQLTARVFAGSFVGAPLARRVLEPSACRLSVDGGEPALERVSLVCAGVVPDLGLGMRLLYRAGEDEARFHVVATALGPRALAPQMPLVLAGRPLLGPNVDALAARVSLAFPEGRGAYVLDGELFYADDVEIAAGPPISVLTPSS